MRRLSQPRADEQLYFSLFGFVIGAHHAGKGIAVGDADGDKPKFIGGRDHLLRVRGAAQEGKVGGYGELGIGGHRYSHANNPCTNQRAKVVSRS